MQTIEKAESKYIKTLGDLKMGDNFKFIFRGEISDKLYKVFQIGKCESACCSLEGNPDSSVWHHQAPVFHVQNKK